MRMRKKPNLLPRMEKCSGVHILEPEALCARWLSEYPDFKELFVELGCGKGRFTAGTAKMMPDKLLVAIERVPDAMIIAMERAIGEELLNVRFLSRDAVNLPMIFAPGEISRIYINFCDPWPAKRHAKRRLTSGGFLTTYKEVLRPGGDIHFKTDNLPLFEYSLEQFQDNGFELSEVTRNLHENGPVGIMTDYEEKFHQQGVCINRCVARLK
jgi:tRNA (guanine-N7-)-methyltransferase